MPIRPTCIGWYVKPLRGGAAVDGCSERLGLRRVVDRAHARRGRRWLAVEFVDVIEACARRRCAAGASGGVCTPGDVAETDSYPDAALQRLIERVGPSWPVALHRKRVRL